MLSQKKDKEKLLNEVICKWILLYYLLKYKFQDEVQWSTASALFSVSEWENKRWYSVCDSKLVIKSRMKRLTQSPLVFGCYIS